MMHSGTVCGFCNMRSCLLTFVAMAVLYLTMILHYNYYDIEIAGNTERSSLDQDNRTRETERKRVESANLSNIVGVLFRQIQNPTDCGKANFFICNIGHPCGTGYCCLMHQLADCFLRAFDANRTVVIHSESTRKDFEKNYLPISSCEPQFIFDDIEWWNNRTQTGQFIRYPGQPYSHTPTNKLDIRSDILERLTSFHGNPSVWWVGQVLRHLLQPNEELLNVFNESSLSMSSGNPVVGVHIRRTDKLISEAHYHSVDEYMQHVENYFTALERKQGVQRRAIYLASDDPIVFEEVQRKYPRYEVFGNPNISRLAGESMDRGSETAQRGIIIDLHFLSQCDYLVCTLSSNVCRFAYEMLQTRYMDASSYVKSLDSGWDRNRNETFPASEWIFYRFR